MPDDVDAIEPPCLPQLVEVRYQPFHREVVGFDLVHEGLPVAPLVVEDHLVIRREVVEEREQLVVPPAGAAVKEHEGFPVPDRSEEVRNAVDTDESLAFPSIDLRAYSGHHSSVARTSAKCQGPSSRACGGRRRLGGARSTIVLACDGSSVEPRRQASSIWSASIDRLLDRHRRGATWRSAQGQLQRSSRWRDRPGRRRASRRGARESAGLARVEARGPGRAPVRR